MLNVPRPPCRTYFFRRQPVDLESNPSATIPRKREQGIPMAQRPDRKRLGKKHRDASTRPKKGRAPRATPTTGAVDPRKRTVPATKKAIADKKKRAPTRSPENESRRTIAPRSQPAKPRSASLGAKKPS